MNHAAEVEGRPRPLSAGIWTLFSWLRRDDRSDSNDSLSSAGSDRTVASFAFLTPAHYHPATTPSFLPPQGPPTDSYKKRVNDRNLRRQHDCDITLHRKYGLFKSSENTCGYDAFSLPTARKLSLHADGRRDRDRRATSEIIQRRLAHVPGKRRAPLPPALKDSATHTRSLTRHSTRKRRAPLPPVKLIENNKENLKEFDDKTVITQMNPNLHDRPNVQNEVSMGCKSEKYSKKEKCNKDTKLKSEKCFLKQIFDHKKRHSGIDISAVKYLPSISELDKQATEIIENSKLIVSEKNNSPNITLKKHDAKGSSQTETWVCVGCSQKYDSSQLNCISCLPAQIVKPIDRGNNDAPSSSKASNSGTQTDYKTDISALIKRSTAEEKQKLKDMLKEMKDSLPKHSKQNLNSKKENCSGIAFETRRCCPYSKETPTLRVGCTTEDENKTPVKSLPSPIITSETHQPTGQSALPVSITNESKKPKSNEIIQENVNVGTKIDTKMAPNNQRVGQTKGSKESQDLHTPLKISSLLDTVYVPKDIETKMQTRLETEKKETMGTTVDNANKISQTTGKLVTAYNPIPGPSTSHSNAMGMENKNVEVKTTTQFFITEQKEIQKAIVKDNFASQNKDNSQLKVRSGKILTSSSTKEQNQLRDINVLSQHSRRRDLIHQLEQSIANGNESAAAEAAAKLAQLRLSCSVLSFSSQILSEPSTSTATTSVDTGKVDSNIETIVKLPDEKVKKEVQKLQLTSVKENSPQKVLLTSSNMVATPVVRKEIPENGSQINIQESLIKNILNAKIKNPTSPTDTMVTISVLVEDREATRGPIQLRIRREAIMKDLRREAETSLGLATNLQRWIVGRFLCVDDNTPITKLAGSDFSAPFYLCVVESETKTDTSSLTKSGSISETKVVEKPNNDKNKPQSTSGNVYIELVQLEQQALVPNPENFECGVCMEEYLPGHGVVLRECVHIFCIDCLADVVRHCEEPDIPCPAMGCRGMLQEREIRALVTPQDYERWLARGLAAAESGTRNAFHCRTRDCKGWALCEPGVQRFPCPVCKHTNCVPCQAIHNGETCEQYRNKLKEAAAKNNSKGAEADDGTRTLLNSLIAKGEALECPECSAVITKKWGCDWVKCSACKTEICWVTRGRRWGPGGKGDTSGGCRCGVDGKRCHPSCGYCH